MAHHTPDGMGAHRHRERQNMREDAAWDSGETHQLVALREHPSIEDRLIREIWGHGSEEEMQELAEDKTEANPDHEFLIEEE